MAKEPTPDMIQEEIIMSVKKALGHIFGAEVEYDPAYKGPNGSIPERRFILKEYATSPTAVSQANFIHALSSELLDARKMQRPDRSVQPAHACNGSKIPGDYLGLDKFYITLGYAAALSFDGATQVQLQECVDSALKKLSLERGGLRGS